MVEDKELIRQYAAERSERAFAELVRRHLNMVYGAALRQVNGDAHLAEDLAQTVFTRLASKAATLQDAASIAGWLYTSTRFAAVKAVRAEARRRAREQTAVSMNEINSNANADWNELRPTIDEALSELGEADRAAIVLRYFESCEFSLVGAALGVSENAARMRVDRALERLRAVLLKRGIATTGAVLAGALAESSATAAPASLAAGITSAALMEASATSAGSAASILKMIAMKKLSLAAIGALAFSVAAVLVVQNLPRSNPRTDVAAPPAAAAQSAPVPLGGPEPSSAAQGDPGLFNRIVQRHDEQARGRGDQDAEEARAAWNRIIADFDASMKEEPGVKKFGLKVMATFPPGQTLVASGWRTPEGKNGLVFVTPTMNPDGANPDQVLIACRLIEVPDEVLEGLGIANFKAQSNGSDTPTEFVSGEQAQATFQAMTNALGSDSVVSPKVIERLGQQASVSVSSVGVIAGNSQRLGLKIDLFPNRSANGPSLDVGILVRYTAATGDGDAPADGP
jgi:RNA polymerase sigma factor (sigma-70 family)